MSRFVESNKVFVMCFCNRWSISELFLKTNTANLRYSTPLLEAGITFSTGDSNTRVSLNKAVQRKLYTVELNYCEIKLLVSVDSMMKHNSLQYSPVGSKTSFVIRVTYTILFLGHYVL